MTYEPAPEPEMLNAAQIAALADAHIHQFERRLASGSPNVNAHECQQYLSIWLSIKNAHPASFDDMDQTQQQEVYDAVMCGDYDDLLNKLREEPVVQEADKVLI